MCNKELKEEIIKKGAKWKAGETSISKLPPEEQMKRLCLLPTEDELKRLKQKDEGDKKKNTL